MNYRRNGSILANTISLRFSLFIDVSISLEFIFSNDTVSG